MMAERVVGLRIQLNGFNGVVTSIKQLEDELTKAKQDLTELAIGSDNFRTLQGEISRTETKLLGLRQASEGIGLEKQLEGYGKLAGGITSSFAAAQSAVALFGNESTLVAEAAAQAQNILTLALSARGVQEVLVGANIVKRTIAEKAATAATLTTNNALKVLYTTIAANPIGALVTAVGLLVAAMVAFNSETEETINLQKELGMVVSDEAVKIQALDNALTDINSTNAERLGSIKELNKIYPGFNAFIDKENKLTKEGADFINKKTKALETQAKITKVLELIQENANKQVEIQNRSLEDSVSFWDIAEASVLSFGNASAFTSRLTKSAAENNVEANKKLEESNKKLQTSLQGLLGQQQENNTELEKYYKLLDEQTKREKELQDANERKEKQLAANLANQKRRNELIESELQRNLANLELSYKEEVKLAKEKGEDVMLVEQVFLKNRTKLFEDYKREFIKVQNETFSELNKITSGSYLVEEAALKKNHQTQREQLQKFYDDLIIIAEKEIKKPNKVVNEQSEIVKKARIKELEEEYKLLEERADLQLSIETAETQTIKDNAKKRLDLLQKNWKDATSARIAAQTKESEIIKNKSKNDATKLNEEKTRIQDEFNKTQAQQELLFTAQLELQRRQVILDGIKADNDLLNLQDDNRLNRNIIVYEKEFELFTENEKRKIRAGIESDAILRKNGEEFTEDEKRNLEELVQSYLKNYDTIAEIVKKNTIARMELSNQLNQIEKKSTDESLKLEEMYYLGITDLQKKYVDNDEILKEKSKKQELLYQVELLNIQRQALQDKLKLLEKDPTLNPEELQKIKNDLLKLEVDYNNKSKDLADITTEDIKKKYEDLISGLQRGLQEVSKGLSDIASLVAQSFQIQLDRLEYSYERTMGNIVGDTEEANQKRIETEKSYQAEKAQIERKAQLSSLRFTLASAIASGAQAVVTALTLPPPASFIVAGLNAGITGVQVGLIQTQISDLESRPLRRGGLLSMGGYISGPSHEQGGVYAGGGYTLEGNESVINRQSTLQYSGLLSQINQSGGGRPIVVQSPMDSRLVEALAKQKTEPIRAYVVEQDITRAQTINRRLEQLASF
jgi:hypothetical protein